jgi:hypothetical protein
MPAIPPPPTRSANPSDSRQARTGASHARRTPGAQLLPGSNDQGEELAAKRNHPSGLPHHPSRRRLDHGCGGRPKICRQQRGQAKRRLRNSLWRWSPERRAYIRVRPLIPQGPGHSAGTHSFSPLVPLPTQHRSRPRAVTLRRDGIAGRHHRCGPGYTSAGRSRARGATDLGRGGQAAGCRGRHPSSNAHSSTTPCCARRRGSAPLPATSAATAGAVG